MTVFEFHEKLTEMFPRSLSASWDNDGIMASADTSREVRRVLVALDPTDAAVKYAREHGFDTLLVHHPMIFTAQKTVTDTTYVGKRVIDALLGGVSVISMHTRLDGGNGGVNDKLLEMLGFSSVGKMGDDELPEIGRYADIEPITAGELAILAKNKLGADMVRLTGDENKLVKRLGVCGGGGGSLIRAAIAAGCDAFLTGDCGYNSSQDAAEEDLVTIEAGHFFSEAPVCGVLASYAESIAEAEVEYYDSNISKIF